MPRDPRARVAIQQERDPIDRGISERQVDALHAIAKALKGSGSTEVLTLLRQLNQNQEKIMAAIDDIRAKLAAANQALAGIRQDITDIKNSIPTSGGMTAEETASVLADVTALSDSLTALDAENPAPPTP